MRVIPLLLPLAVALPAALHADAIVNDRGLDPIGTAQYRPMLALVTGTTSHVGHLVCMWEQQSPGGARQYRLAVSADVHATPELSWVQQGLVPGVTGYDWLEDLKLGSGGLNQPQAGSSLIVGQIRSQGAAPRTYGIASIRGHVANENTVTWETPQIIETFGSQSAPTIVINALSLHVAPESGVAYVNYLNGLISPLYEGWWFRRSSNLGLTWSAPMPAPGDTTMLNGIFVTQTGATANVLRCLTLPQPVSGDPSVLVFTSTDSGLTFGASSAIGTMAVEYPRNPHLIVNSNGPVMDFDPATGSFYLLAPAPMLHATVFPPVSGSPAVLEVEPNNQAAQATPASPGAVLRGALTPGGAPADTDLFSMSLSAGQSLMLLPDSASSSISLTMLGTDGRSVLCHTAGTSPSGELDFTAPVAGTYDVVVSRTGTTGTTTYRVRTVSASAPAGGARDQYDTFISRSQPGGGTPWTSLSNVSASTTTAGYDEDGATFKVNLDGEVYAGWYDWSAQPAREISRYVVTRSGDDGVSWDPIAPINLANSDWTYVPYTQTPQSTFGPEQAVVTDGMDLYYAWTDVRNGDADVFSRVLRRELSLQSVSPPAPTATAGQVLHLQLGIKNLDDLFGWSLTLSAQAGRNWPGATASASLGAGFASVFDLPLPIPDSAATGDVTLHLRVASSFPPQTVYLSSDVVVGVQGTASVADPEARLALAPVAPNPARNSAELHFSLSRAGRASLAIYGLDGRRVKSLGDGELGAGRHARVWNGADESGAPVASGEYFIALEAEGRRMTRRMVWLH